MDRSTDKRIVSTSRKWRRAFGEGGKVVCGAALDQMALRARHGGPHFGHIHAMVIGAIVALTYVVRDVTEQNDLDLDYMERLVLAYVRGEMRDANGPVNEDGTPYEPFTQYRPAARAPGHE